MIDRITEIYVVQTLQTNSGYHTTSFNKDDNNYAKEDAIDCYNKIAKEKSTVHVRLCLTIFVEGEKETRYDITLREEWP